MRVCTVLMYLYVNVYVIHLSCYRRFPRFPVSFNLGFAMFPCFYLAATARTARLHRTTLLRILQKAPADSNCQSRPTELTTRNSLHCRKRSTESVLQYVPLFKILGFWKSINLSPRIAQNQSNGKFGSQN